MTVVCLSHPKTGHRVSVTVGVDAGHEQGTVAVDVMVMSSSASGHMYLLFFALSGQKSSGCTVIVDVGQVGTRDAVAVTFQYDVVANVELERLDIWCLVCERGRALGEDVSLCGPKNRKKRERKGEQTRI